jgi:peptidoglycan-associated lipoprotein
MPRAIYFDFDASLVRNEAREVLERYARALKQNPHAKVRIEGNCDERGTEEFNLALGETRAQAARKYLITLGVSASRIESVSYGKERPADPGHDEAAWSKNRRDDLSIQ